VWAQVAAYRVEDRNSVHRAKADRLWFRSVRRGIQSGRISTSDRASIAKLIAADKIGDGVDRCLS
jgi:hypothetical protein